MGECFATLGETIQNKSLYLGRSSTSELRDIIDKGIIAVAQNDFQTAQTSFENALKLEPSNAMVITLEWS